jgi:hypothetical protein
MSQFDQINENDETAAPTDAAGFGDELLESGETAEESSPQRGALLLLLLIVVVGGGGLFVMHKKAAPTAAVASAETTQATSAISAFLTNGNRNIAEMRDLLRDTEKVVDQFLRYPSVSQVKLDQLKTNPFELQKPKTVVVTNDGAAAKARLAALEREKAEMANAVARLSLQSILWSDKGATCLLNGRVCHEGEAIQGFVVKTIERTSVTVSKGEYSFKLALKQPN